MEALPSEGDVLGWFESLSNWGRWGEEDQQGTLNHVTAAKRREAAALISDGAVVSCSLPVSTQYPVGGMNQRFMLKTGQGLGDTHRHPYGYSESDRVGVASDYLCTYYHGIDVTHVDALCHMFFDRVMYNGRPAELVTAAEGAAEHAISAIPGGIVSRGVLLDIPGLRGVDWLGQGEAVLPADLEAAEARQSVTVEAGDVILLRTGNGHRRSGGPTWMGYPGWHAACLPWLQERAVAAIGHDGPTDAIPSGYPQLAVPIHTIGIVAMGLWVIDNLDLEPLVSACRDRNRWTFLFVLAPLLWQGATGSPANPLALL